MRDEVMEFMGEVLAPLAAAGKCHVLLGEHRILARALRYDATYRASVLARIAQSIESLEALRQEVERVSRDE